MRNLSVILVIFGLQLVYGHYQGPFLLWGVENLNDIKIPTLQAIDDQNLHDIYTKASAIVIFIKNAKTKLSYENFPELSNIIGKNEWLYLPQESLSSDPFEFNVNVEVFTLTGPAVMQDNEIAAFYHDLQVKHDNKNILGILAMSSNHLVSKREVITGTTVLEPDQIYIYEATGKGLLYTTEVPILSITEHGATIKHNLTTYEIVTGITVGDEFILTVDFVISRKIVAVGFIFYISAGNWDLTHVKYGDKKLILNVVGTHPAAPIGFSYACGDTIVFRSENVSLTLKGIQVQPLLNGAKKFSRAYDCTGYFTAPILSGLFIASIMIFILTIGITALLDIKTPTRFENRHSKPLTFAVQE